MEKESFTGLTCPALRTPGVAKACVWSGVLYILNRHQPKSNCTYFRHLRQPPILSQFPTLNKTSQGVPPYPLLFPRPFVDRPNYALAKVFSVALRGPPWTKKVFSPALREQTKLCPCKSQFRQTSTSPSNPAGTRQFTFPYPLPPAVPPTTFPKIRADSCGEQGVVVRFNRSGP